MVTFGIVVADALLPKLRSLCYSANYGDESNREYGLDRATSFISLFLPFFFIKNKLAAQYLQCFCSFLNKYNTSEIQEFQRSGY